MDRNGLLTIGVPTYNGGRNLPGLLASVGNLGLSEEAYEIVIVDNGSTDDTNIIVQQLKLSYGNIIYHKNGKNIGRVENWNKVLQVANGEFLILMNVNDSFLNFDAGKYISYLKNNPDVALVMNDVVLEDYVYPNWMEAGAVDLDAYVRKTFLEVDYLEFHSLGVLQQHIFRMQVIRDHNLKFTPEIPRTADRVFIAWAIKHGGGRFLYSARPIVSWQLNSNRYHHQVHNNLAHFNFEQLWVNEYKANSEVARIVEIPYAKMLKGQLVAACFMKLANWFRNMKSNFFKRQSTDDGIEIMTAYLYYEHLKDTARLNGISANYALINWLAFKRAVIWFLRSVNIWRKKVRTIKDIAVPRVL